MASVILDFYDEDASSSLLGSLEDDDLETFALRPALFDLGALVFTVPKAVAEASPTLLRKTNLVRVRFPTPMGTTRVWAGVLKDVRSVILSKGEQAGEYVEWTAPGALFLLSYGALGTASTVSDQPARGSYDDVPARDWIWTNQPYGAILTRLIEEGRHSPFPAAAAADSPLEDIDIDFDRVTDSAGNPWTSIAEEFRVPIGSNMLEVAAQLATAGDLFLVMDSDLTLHAYQDYDDFATDRTGAFSAGNIRWERGTNILTELSRQSTAIPATHLIQRDSDGNSSTETISGYTSGREHYVSTVAESTNDDATLNKIAQRTLQASGQDAEQIAFEVIAGNDDANGEYFPFTDFNCGDLVTLDTGSGSYDFNEASLRVVAFRITLDQASQSSTSTQAYRSLHLVPELAFRPLNVWSTLRSGGEGSGGCQCPRPCQPGTTGSNQFLGSACSNSGTNLLSDYPPWSGDREERVQLDIVETVSIGYSLIAVATNIRTHAHALQVYDSQGNTWTMDAEHENTGSSLDDYVTIWRCNVTSALGPGDYVRWAGNLSSSLSASVEINERCIGVYMYAGELSNPVPGTGAGSFAGSGTISTPAGDIVVAAITSDLDPPETPVDPDWDAMIPYNHVGDHTILAQQLAEASATTFTSDWTGGSRDWSAIACAYDFESVVTPADGHPDLVGEDIRYSRCDHRHDLHRADAPTVNDDELDGYKLGTVWAQLDDLDDPTAIVGVWMLVDATEGAAVWLDILSSAAPVIDYGEDADISTLDYDDVADAGVLDEVARADHVHGMPSEPSSSSGGIGEILISDTPSTPLVFADLLQNEAEDDLLYADP